MGGFSIRCDCEKWFLSTRAYRDHCKSTGHHNYLNDQNYDTRNSWKPGDIDRQSGAFEDYEKDPDYYEMGK